MDSFMQWCESAREDFKLGPALDEQLAQRRFRAGMTQEYRDWRAMARVLWEMLKLRVHLWHAARARPART